MSKSWPKVRLGEVLTYRKEFICISDLETYKRCRVQLHAQGIVLRDNVVGAEIKTKKQQVCRSGELLVAEIDAKVGGFGIVPEDLEGAIVSGHYFLYKIDENKLHKKFMDYYIRTATFREQVTAQGSTNYAAIRSSDVLEYTIPLPSLSEQQKIVARIEQLAVKVEEARGLRRQAIENANHTLIFMAYRDDIPETVKKSLGWIEVTLGDVITQVENRQKVDPDKYYPNLGIYSFGRGLFRKPPIQGFQTSATFLNQVYSGQFIYSRLFAFEGSYGMVTAEYDQCFVSNEYPTFTCDMSKLLPEFLYVYFKRPHVWSQVAAGSRGVGDRRQRVQPSQLLSHRIMLPPMKNQIELCEIMRQVASLDRLQSDTAAELDVLLPAVLDKAFKGEL